MQKSINVLRIATIVLFTFIIVSMFNVNVNAAVKTELPVNGSTGFAAIDLNLRNGSGKVIGKIPAGKAFTIDKEVKDRFYVKYGTKYGTVYSGYVLVNLPDVIPSIVYKNTNTVHSIFMSSGQKLSGITDRKLYDAYFYNERFKKKQFVMPVLWPMVSKIQSAQNEALANNETLVIYETYRPYDVQMSVSASLSKALKTNRTVRRGIEDGQWGKSWFIATRLSNHQRGIAMDVSLAKVTGSEIRRCGKYNYRLITGYKEYSMPSKMHELSNKAVTFSSPVSSKSTTAWKRVSLSSGMKRSTGAKKLQKYCTNAGLTPLASEWWHFNDLSCPVPAGSSGRFRLSNCVSKTPQ